MVMTDYLVIVNQHRHLVAVTLGQGIVGVDVYDLDLDFERV
jgi:hypothetical protein